MLTRTTKAEGRPPIVRGGAKSSEPAYYGLGWAINATAAGDLIHHSRSNGSKDTAFRCYCEFDPQRGTGIVVMTNAEGGRQLWQELIAAVSEP